MAIFTWFFFIINPALGTILALVGLYKNRKKNVHYSVMLALFFSSLAYWFVPNHEMDLTRYFLQLSNYSKLSWNQMIQRMLESSSHIVEDLLFYGVAKTGNFHLLPAIVIFTTYFITFYVITDFSKRKNISRTKMMKVIIFTICVLPFPSLVSNVRNVLAFSIFVLALYRELEQGKRNTLTWLLYIIPLFIHISTLALLVVRILIQFYDLNKKRTYIISMGIISSTVMVKIAAKIVDILPFSNNVLFAFINKANYYISDTTTDYAIYLQTNLFPRLQKLYFILVVLYLLLTLIIVNMYVEKNRNIFKRLNPKEKKMLSFYSLICLTVLGTAPIVLTVYFRFTIPVIMLSPVIILRKDIFVFKKLYRQIISLGLFAIGIGGVLHQWALMHELTNIPFMIFSVMTKSLLNMFIP